jgi:hypothetical protein
MTPFFWWTMHFLLDGRIRWRTLLPSAVITGVFYGGLGVFSKFYFSETIIGSPNLTGCACRAVTRGWPDIPAVTGVWLLHVTAAGDGGGGPGGRFPAVRECAQLIAGARTHSTRSGQAGGAAARPPPASRFRPPDLIRRPGRCGHWTDSGTFRPLSMCGSRVSPASSSWPSRGCVRRTASPETLESGYPGCPVPVLRHSVPAGRPGRGPGSRCRCSIVRPSWHSAP